MPVSWLNFLSQTLILLRQAIYDSIYIALAEKLNYPLITVDQRQAKASQSEGVTLKDIADFTS